MRDRDYTIGLDFLGRFYGNGRTKHKVELRNFPNLKGPAKQLFSRDPEKVEEFLVAHDQPGRGTFFAVATREGNDGSREGCKELPAVWCDIDCNKIGVAKDKAVEILRSLPYPPSLITDSGGGVHAWWLLREAEDISIGADGWEEKEERIVSVLRRLKDVLCGDPQVCEVARVMRLPSTHNTKDGVGDAKVVFIEAHWERTFELGDLDEWLCEQRIMITQPGAGDASPEVNPYLAAAQATGWKPPLDVKALLEGMRYHPRGDSNVHDTQLRCSAALVAHGDDDEEIVSRLMDATRAAAGRYHESWNWRAEERELRRMIADAHKKGYGAKHKQEREPEAEESKKEATNDSTAETIDLGKERQKRERAKQEKAQAQQGEPKQAKKDKTKDNGIEQVAAAVIAHWQDKHGPLMSSEGSLWVYSTGIWERVQGSLEARLRTDISGMARLMKAELTGNFLNNVWRALIEDPKLYTHNVPWDQHKLVVATNGAIDPLTLALQPHDPGHFATQRLNVALDPAAACPKWLSMLDAAFANLDTEERGRVIATLSEFFGSALLRGKPRDITKALFIVGESRCGKTQIASILRSLVGGRVCSVRARDLGDRFGMEPLVGASAWIADDAVGTGEFLDAEAFKLVTTGEEVSVQRKNDKNWQGRLDLAVTLTANHRPRVKDQSDAVYNRVLILPMQVVFGERDARDRSREPWQVIVDEELAGVLVWALAGLQRLIGRGYYDPPAYMTQANAEFKDDNQSISPWLKAAVESHEEFMVDRRDVVDSYRGWHADEWGIDPKHKPLHPRALWALIRQLTAGRKLDVDGRRARTGERFVTGVRLTPEGIGFIDRLSDAIGRNRDQVGSGCDSAQVNKIQPEFD
jgi:P4 family phage/plasmid primase-like protien